MGRHFQVRHVILTSKRFYAFRQVRRLLRNISGKETEPPELWQVFLQLCEFLTWMVFRI